MKSGQAQTAFREGNLLPFGLGLGRVCPLWALAAARSRTAGGRGGLSEKGGRAGSRGPRLRPPAAGSNESRSEVSIVSDTPQQQTAAADVSSPPMRVTVEQLAEGMSTMDAYRAGRFAALGAPAPPERVPRSRRGRPW